MDEAVPPPEAIKRLAALFERNGYIRRVNAIRKEREGNLYKKGGEVRLVAESLGELTEIQRLLKQAGFKVARPFAKGRQWRQPLYGIAEVARFLSLVGKARKPQTKMSRRAAAGVHPEACPEGDGNQLS